VTVETAPTDAASVAWRPPAQLSPYVAAAVGYRFGGLPAGQHRGLPSPYVTVVLSLDSDLVVGRHADPHQAPDAYGALVGGLHTSPVLLAMPGRQVGIQLSLTVAGARALLGVPAAELVQIDAHLAEVLGPDADRLRDRLAGTAGWPARFGILERWLTARLDPAAELPAEVARAWSLILAGRGAEPVSSLGAQVGWSSRHLRTRFAGETGLSPKHAARVVRFDRARRMLQHRYLAGGSPELARLAAVTGYVDQAHLAREFRALAGCPPTTWLAEEFPEVQASAAARAAQWSA
jgi:AraC-like DNA-binding protein